jgi:hypothetical protein
MTKQELVNKYPKIFNVEGYEKLPFPMFGIECGDGWLSIIDCLCATLQFDTDRNNAPQVVCIQCKEKFGGLRFYIAGGTHKQYAQVNVIEHLSYRICETCGKLHDHAIERDIGNGWIGTLCEDCLKTYKEKRSL